MGALATLVDDFNDNSLDATKWTNTSGSPSETGGEIHLPCTAAYSWLVSAASYDVRDSHALAELTQPPSVGAGTTQTSLEVQNGDGSNRWTWTWSGGSWYPQEALAGVYDAGGLSFADGADFAWLRISESGGTITWDSSADGMTWTTRRSKTAGWSTATPVQAGVTCGYYGAETSPTGASWDNFNLAPVASVFYQSASSRRPSVVNPGAPSAR